MGAISARIRSIRVDGLNLLSSQRHEEAADCLAYLVQLTRGLSDQRQSFRIQFVVNLGADKLECFHGKARVTRLLEARVMEWPSYASCRPLRYRSDDRRSTTKRQSISEEKPERKVPWAINMAPGAVKFDSI